MVSLYGCAWRSATPPPLFGFLERKLKRPIFVFSYQPYADRSKR
jgi:hypothetical protein